MTSAQPPAAPPPLPPLDPPSWPPPPPPGPPPVRPQLRRSRTDKILGGVNGGLAEYSGIDALLWRVGFVALTLAGGAGIIVYLLLWLLMPAGPRAVPGTEVAKAPAGPRSPVPGVTLAGLLIVVGLLALITHFSGWDIGARGFLGSALLVVGLGLVVGAFTGGRTARGGLIALGVVLSLGLITASSVDWRHAGDGVGDRTYLPSTVAEVPGTYRGGVGDLTVDFTRLARDVASDPVTTRIEHGVGDLQIVVPDSADVRLEIEHGLGDVEVFDRGSATSGFFPGTGSSSWTDDGQAEFVLTINNGVGDVEVSRG
jgi:phage shock protein PspC (stress-responsive transcriptional regulator)